MHYRDIECHNILYIYNFNRLLNFQAIHIYVNQTSVNDDICLSLHLSLHRVSIIKYGVHKSLVQQV